MNVPNLASLDTEVDALYGAPLDQFVRRRDDVARRLRASKRFDEAATVASMTCPTPVAWAVNRLYFDLPSRVTSLARLAIEAAEHSDSWVRIARTKEHALLLDELVSVGVRLLSDHGHHTTADTPASLRQTLESLSRPGGQERAGRLVGDMTPKAEGSPGPGQPEVDDSAPSEDSDYIVLDGVLPEESQVLPSGRSRPPAAPSRPATPSGPPAATSRPPALPSATRASALPSATRASALPSATRASALPSASRPSALSSAPTRPPPSPPPLGPTSRPPPLSGVSGAVHGAVPGPLPPSSPKGPALSPPRPAAAATPTLPSEAPIEPERTESAASASAVSPKGVQAPLESANHQTPSESTAASTQAQVLLETAKKRLAVLESNRKVVEEAVSQANRGAAAAAERLNLSRALVEQALQMLEQAKADVETNETHVARLRAELADADQQIEDARAAVQLSSRLQELLAH